MKPERLALLFLFFLFACAQTSLARGVEALAHKAISEDSAESASAITELRAAGPAGLHTLFQVYAEEINRHIADPSFSATPEWTRLTAALDAVSQQKDSYLSALYWYTDFNEAKAAARVAGKPILSLRLLGKLSEEFSCANSRFFRTVLYANAEVAKTLGENFILHWQTVRAAPRVTIDFGDGRKLERTITGNSIHYILEPDGRPLDALPGLYGPQSFLRALHKTKGVFDQVIRLDPNARLQALLEYHRAAVRSTTADWLADAQSAGGKIPESLLPRTAAKGSPTALEIAPLAVTKALTELTIMRAMTREADALGAVMDESTWNKIAVHHVLEAKLDDCSIGLIRHQTLGLLATMDGSDSTREQKLLGLLQKFQHSIALDTVRNEYLLHTKLHAWLAGYPNVDVDTLNDKVYAELFLTPKSDPWLGLLSPDVYVALEDGGLIR